MDPTSKAGDALAFLTLRTLRKTDLWGSKVSPKLSRRVADGIDGFIKSKNIKPLWGHFLGMEHVLSLSCLQLTPNHGPRTQLSPVPAPTHTLVLSQSRRGPLSLARPYLSLL